jgi:hypothetical protein
VTLASCERAARVGAMLRPCHPLFGFYLRSFSITAFSSCIFCVRQPISKLFGQHLEPGFNQLAGHLVRNVVRHIFRLTDAFETTGAEGFILVARLTAREDMLSLPSYGSKTERAWLE